MGRASPRPIGDIFDEAVRVDVHLRGDAGRVVVDPVEGEHACVTGPSSARQATLITRWLRASSICRIGAQCGKSSPVYSRGSTRTHQLPELSRRIASTPYGRSAGVWTKSTPLAVSSL